MYYGKSPAHQIWMDFGLVFGVLFNVGSLNFDMCLRQKMVGQRPTLQKKLINADQHGANHAAEGIGLGIGVVAKVGCAGRINTDDNCITAKALRIKFGWIPDWRLERSSMRGL